MNLTENTSRKRLEIGTPVTVVKLRPDGGEAIRYPGEIINAPTDWVAVRAPWGQRRVDLGYLTFEPNDVFFEYFSLSRPFNAFAICTNHADLKGWYCNVTYPSWVEDALVYWHDLYVDVIAYPNGRMLVLDEDELEESGLATSDPTVYQLILDARDELQSMISRREYPFDQHCR